MSIARNFYYLSLALLFFISSYLSAEMLDLEKFFEQDIVIENKQIDIPGYPYAFNPSIVRWKNSLLMSIRHIPNAKDSFTSHIGLVWLDENFNPTGKPQFLNPRPQSSRAPLRAEDARLLTVNDRLYIIYSDNEDVKISKGGFRVYVAELINDNGYFSIKEPECLSQFEGENKNLREKNWVPFDYEGNLLLAYSISPHKILQPRLDKSGSCDVVFSTQNNFTSWEWGIPRGGTPGLKIGNEYLSFFHSSVEMQTLHSNQKKIWHYFMGAYTYEAAPPFTITRTSKIPIVGDRFYNGFEYRPYWKPVKVVFPCGFIHDYNYVWVVYGKDDHEIWITKLDKNKLLESLLPVGN